MNALLFARRHFRRFDEHHDKARESFNKRFWDPSRGYLLDVVDVDHVAGKVDASLRPNQILAAGGLPLSVVDDAIQRRVVKVVEEHLWTPMGLRSLAPSDPAYRGRYEGGVKERDGAYHQGTVWPWLLGPFVDAWLRAHGESREVKDEAYKRFVVPMLSHLGHAGLGHVSELADGDAPHAPKGAPFQAWSVTELLRLARRFSRR